MEIYGSTHARILPFTCVDLVDLALSVVWMRQLFDSSTFCLVLCPAYEKSSAEKQLHQRPHRIPVLKIKSVFRRNDSDKDEESRDIF